VGRSKRRVKGLSEVVAAVLAFSMISLTLVFIYVASPKPTTKVAQPYVENILKYTYENALVWVGEEGYVVRNVGSSPMSLDLLIVNSNGDVLLLNATANNLCVANTTLILPNEEAKIRCNEANTNLIGLIARSGEKLNHVKTFYIDPRLYSFRPITRTINQTVLLKPEILTNIAKYFEDPTLASEGAINTSLALMLYRNSSGTIQTSNLKASLLIVTKAPGTTDRLNILIVGRGSEGGNLKISGGNIDENIPISKVGYYRYRIKIINFTGSLKVSGSPVNNPGIFPCLIDRGSSCSVSINGSADRILLYTNDSRTSSIVGSEPYFIVGDLDGNGYSEFIFSTQDFTVGNSSSTKGYNDYITVGSNIIRVVERSVKPLRIVFSDNPINSSKYSVVVVSVRLFFWDNSVDDITDNDNRVVLRIGLYDEDAKDFIYSTYLSYYELCRYRGVKPFSISYIVKDFLLYIPPQNVGKQYYIAIDFLDPFYYESSSKRNDADIILGIEYVGAVMGVR